MRGHVNAVGFVFATAGGQVLSRCAPFGQQRLGMLGGTSFVTSSPKGGADGVGEQAFERPLGWLVAYFHEALVVL